MNRTPARIALLFFGVFCGATAVIMIKASDESPLLIAAYRLLLATMFLSPLFFRQKQKTDQPYGREQLRWSALPGLFLAAHFITWTIGVPMTQVSNASLIVNMTPVVMPFFLWLFFRERVNRKEVLGTLLAISGHIHEAAGIDHLGPTTLVNPGSFRQGRYAVADLSDGRVQVRLGSC